MAEILHCWSQNSFACIPLHPQATLPAYIDQREKRDLNLAPALSVHIYTFFLHLHKGFHSPTQWYKSNTTYWIELKSSLHRIVRHIMNSLSKRNSELFFCFWNMRSKWNSRFVWSDVFWVFMCEGILCTMEGTISKQLKVCQSWFFYFRIIIWDELFIICRLHVSFVTRF